jgi:hypothetical protein
VTAVAQKGENRNTLWAVVWNLKERNCLEDLGVYGRIILKWIVKNRMDVDWIHLAVDRDM